MNRLGAAGSRIALAQGSVNQRSCGPPVSASRWGSSNSSSVPCWASALSCQTALPSGITASSASTRARPAASKPRSISSRRKPQASGAAASDCQATSASVRAWDCWKCCGASSMPSCHWMRSGMVGKGKDMVGGQPICRNGAVNSSASRRSDHCGCATTANPRAPSLTRAPLRSSGIKAR